DIGIVPTPFSENSFSEQGLRYSGVWSQTIKEVLLRNKIAEVVSNSKGFDDDYPVKICEQFANHDDNFFGVASLNVDLLKSDSELIDEFKSWLKNSRKFHLYDKKLVTEKKLEQWSKNRALAYWDFIIWLKNNNYTYGVDKDIPKIRAYEWFLTGIKKINDERKDPQDLIDASRRDFETISSHITARVLGRLSFKPLKIKSCQIDVSEFISGKE
ncbi:MAG: hypothetical protein KDI92_16030, partial [Xanthomonadales bacterium]|nr:hypothetical protein [Xanthomonadales bacterium]